MARAARILVVGESLPFKAELKEHREIETRWVRTAPEVASWLRKAKVDACIVTPDFDDREVIWLIRKSLGQAPCLVLVDHARERASWPPDIATAVIPVEEVQSIVMLLAQYTGLRLARYPRADIAAPVMISIHGRTFDRTSRDLSLSGIAINDFPKAPIGVRADLTLMLSGKSLHLRARLVRWLDGPAQTVAGLNFIDMPEGPRAIVHTAVQEALQKLPLQWEIDELFGDLALEEQGGCRALRTADVASSPLPAFLPRTADLEIPLVRALLEGEAQSAEVPAWLNALVSDLTGVEAAAARDRPAPPWAMSALKLRINLARVRDRFADRPPPSALIDDAYRMFERLRKETEGEKGAILAQVRRIRTALLRDMVALPRTEDVEPSSALDAPQDKAS